MGKFYPEVKLAYAIRGNRCKQKQSVTTSNNIFLLRLMMSCFPVQRGRTIEEQVVIGTPGTVLDWVLKLKLMDPKKISVFVLDEADIMIATQGHQDQSIRIQRWGVTFIMKRLIERLSNPSIHLSRHTYLNTPSSTVCSMNLVLIKLKVSCPKFVFHMIRA